MLEALCFTNTVSSFIVICRTITQKVTTTNCIDIIKLTFFPDSDDNTLYNQLYVDPNNKSAHQPMQPLSLISMTRQYYTSSCYVNTSLSRLCSRYGKADRSQSQ